MASDDRFLLDLLLETSSKSTRRRCAIELYNRLQACRRDMATGANVAHDRLDDVKDLMLSRVLDVVEAWMPNETPCSTKDEHGVAPLAELAD